MNNDVEMLGDNIEKVAILDAGAQYGKVSAKFDYIFIILLFFLNMC